MIAPIPLAGSGRCIGPGNPCFIAAEIGINHNGDMALAKEMIAAAAQAGVDGVKFQNYNVDDFLVDRTLPYTYLSAGTTVTESQYEMFRRCQLDRDQLSELKETCESHRVLFFSTPTGLATIADLMAIGTVLLKNGSDLLTNDAVVSAMARCNVPSILSTGMATLAEIEHAVNCYRTAGGTALILLHCTSQYPTPPERINLRRIPILSSAFDCVVGFSDHSEGVTAAVASVACGSCFIEKHFTIDRHLPGPDQWFSSDPSELTALVKGVRDVELALGRPTLSAAESQSASRTQFQLSCVATHDLTAGEVVTEEMIAISRPGWGIKPQDIEHLIGMQLTQRLAKGTPFLWEHFKHT